MPTFLFFLIKRGLSIRKRGHPHPWMTSLLVNSHRQSTMKKHQPTNNFHSVIVNTKDAAKIRTFCHETLTPEKKHKYLICTA